MKFCITDVDCGLGLAERQKVAAALQRQLREHFAPAWDGLCSDATVRAATPDALVADDEIDCRLQKTPTQDGALGFHDRSPAGLPIIYIFAALCKAYGEEWSKCLSHELVECAADPYLQKCVQMENGDIQDFEVADRVEADSYQIDGVTVSNFNTKNCFEPPKNTVGLAFDFLRLSTRPNEVRPGGYSQTFVSGKGWKQNSPSSAYRTALSKAGVSRGARRAAKSPARGFFSRLFGIIRRAF